MVSPHVSSRKKRNCGIALALALILLTAEIARAQNTLTTPLRGPPIAFRPSTVTPQFTPNGATVIFGPAGGTPGAPPFPQVGQRYTAQLFPGQPPTSLVNNGNLNVWLNPVPHLPNQIPYTYQATIPEGDRLAKNGIVDDTNLLPTIGFSPILPLPFGPGATVPGFQLGALAPIEANILNFMGDQFARRRLAMQLAFAQAQQQAMMAAAAAVRQQQQLPLQPFQAAAPVGGFGAAQFGFGNQPRMNAFGGAPVQDKVKNKDDDKKDDGKKDDANKDDDKKDEKKFGKGYAEKKDS